MAGFIARYVTKSKLLRYMHTLYRPMIMKMDLLAPEFYLFAWKSLFSFLLLHTYTYIHSMGLLMLVSFYRYETCIIMAILPSLLECYSMSLFSFLLCLTILLKKLSLFKL